jgi:hypothetical protein
MEPTMPKLRLSLIAPQVVAVPIGLFLSGLLVWNASNAAFTATTSSGGNQWRAGTVALTSDANGQPMFNVSNIKPGDTGQRCIAITSTSNFATAVKLYGSESAPPTNDIDPYINLTIEKGTGGSFSSCTGFTPTASAPGYTGTLENFLLTNTNYSNGIGPWPLTGASPPETMTFRFNWTFSTTAPNTAQNGTTASITFIWEAQQS